MPEIRRRFGTGQAGRRSIPVTPRCAGRRRRPEPTCGRRPAARFGHPCCRGTSATATNCPDGQWQRLAVARGLFRDAPLLIWDEPTAALDAKAEYAVYESLRRIAGGRTVVLITHRLASARGADETSTRRCGSQRRARHRVRRVAESRTGVSVAGCRPSNTTHAGSRILTWSGLPLDANVPDVLMLQASYCYRVGRHTGLPDGPANLRLHQHPVGWRSSPVGRARGAIGSQRSQTTQCYELPDGVEEHAADTPMGDPAHGCVNRYRCPRGTRCCRGARAHDGAVGGRIRT